MCDWLNLGIVRFPCAFHRLFLLGAHASLKGSRVYGPRRLSEDLSSLKNWGPWSERKRRRREEKSHLAALLRLISRQRAIMEECWNWDGGGLDSKVSVSSRAAPAVRLADFKHDWGFRKTKEFRWLSDSNSVISSSWCVCLQALQDRSWGDTAG